MTAIDSFARGRYEAIREHGLPVWLLGLVVAILTWNLTFAPPTPGLDASWMSALYMAANDGKNFGTEVVFTYGPLGFMKAPAAWFGDLGELAYVYSAVVLLSFSTFAIWTLRDRMGLVGATLVTFSVLAFVPGLDYSLAVSVLAAFALLSRKRTNFQTNVVVIAGAVFASAEALMKLSSGPVIFLVLLMSLIGSKTSLKLLGIYLGVFFTSFLGFWFVTGQALGDLPNFVANSIQVVLGYPEAMSTYSSSATTGMFMLVVVCGTVIWTWFGDYLDLRRRLAATAVSGLVGLAAYKQGVVRLDDAHLAIFYGAIVLLWIAVPARRLLTAGTVLGVAIWVIAAHHAYATYVPGVKVWESTQVAVRETARALIPNRRDDFVAERRALLQQYYAVPESALRELQGQTVSVDPFEDAVAWAYELNWHPVPTLQNYTAYTSDLDQLNSDTIESPDGPQRILRANVIGSPDYPTGAIDGRYPGWDPPEQAIATLCNFVPDVTTPNWQVLSRVEDRCGAPIPAGSIQGSFNSPVRVPKPGRNEIVFVRIDGAQVQGLEKLRSLIYKPAVRNAIMSSGVQYRLLGTTADDGLLLKAGSAIGQDLPPFGQVPQTDSIELTGIDGPLTFNFFRMRLNRSSTTVIR